MTKNVKILGNTYNGVDTLNAKEADSEGVVKFVETSDANAVAEDIKRDKTAYVNGQKVIGTSDAIVPEGTLSVNVHKSHQTANVTNYENVEMNLVDVNGSEIGREVYEGVFTSDSNIGLERMQDGVYKIQFGNASSLSQGVYQVDSYDATSLYSGELTPGWYNYKDSSLSSIDQPGEVGVYHFTYGVYGSPKFDQLTEGFYQLYENNPDSIPTPGTYHLYMRNGYTQKQTLGSDYHYYVIADTTSTPVGLTYDKYYYLGSGAHHEVTTYPKANGNYTYNKSTDSFTNAPPAPSGTLSVNADGYNDTFDVTNYAEVEVTVTTKSGEELQSEALYIKEESGIEASSRGVYLVFDDTGNYKSEDIVDTTKNGVFAFNYDIGGSASYLEEITDGHYNISDGEPNAIATYPQADGGYTYNSSTDSFTALDTSAGYYVNSEGQAEKLPDVSTHTYLINGDGYEPLPDRFYELFGNSADSLEPGTFITDPENITSLSVGAYDIYSNGENVYGASRLSGYFYCGYGSSVETIDNLAIFDVIGGSQYTVEIREGYTYKFEYGTETYLTSTLRSYSDIGTDTIYDDMEVGAEETVTFVNGKQFKITRIQ